MQPCRAITRMLSILGLVLALFTVPAMAGGMDASMLRDAILTDMMPKGDASVTAEVSCCVPAVPSMPDCPKVCPLAAMCHAKIVEGVSTVSAVLRWSSPAQALLPGNDATPETLTQAPPARPPQA